MSFWTDALGAEVKYYDVQGVRTRTIQAGDRGDVVIMMHGLGGHAETYIKNVVPVAEAGFRVYAIDAVGHGYSDKPTDITYSTHVMVEHLADFMDVIGAQKAHFVGQSLGGWTMMNFALRYPERTASLTSVTGAGLLLEKDKEAVDKSVEIRKDTRKRHEKAESGTLTIEKIKERVGWLMASPATPIDEIAEIRFKIYALADSQKAMRKVSTEMLSEENRKTMLREPELERIVAPTFFIWTDRNPSTPASHAKKASEIMPNARFELVADAGHWAQYEQADTVNRLMIDFLRSV